MKVKADIDSYCVGISNVEDSDDPWSYQGDEEWHSTLSSVRRSEDGQFEVEDGATLVHVVTHLHSDGSTFGSQSGYMSVVDIFTEIEEARSLANAVEAFIRTGKLGVMRHDGGSYYITGAGTFFGSAYDVEVISMKVTG